MPLYAGTSGIALPVPNKASFPESFRDKPRLTYYASLFNTIEINSTFKTIPADRTIAKWASLVPANFRFTFKMHKSVTHEKGLVFDKSIIDRFMNVINGANEKKGCLLLQFPGKLDALHSPALKKLLILLRRYDKAGQWRIALEFRNVSWYSKKTANLLAAYNAIMVHHDMHGSATSLHTDTLNTSYFRLHGTEKKYGGSYSLTQLQPFIDSIRLRLNDGKTVYAYFNNTLGNAASNALELQSHINM